MTAKMSSLKRIYPTKPRNAYVRTGMHLEVIEVLQARPMSAASVSTALRLPLHAVESCMRSMARRGEIKRLECKPGQWARYKLLEADHAAHQA